MSGGWDDDDDLLDAMLDVDEVGGGVDENAVEEEEDGGIAAAVGVSSSGATAAAPATATATSANPFMNNDDDDEGEEINEDGWGDDDDLEGLSSSEGSGVEEKGPVEPSSSHSPLPSPPHDNDGDGDDESANILDTTMENTFAMFQEHEAIMERELGALRNDVLFAQEEPSEQQRRTTLNNVVDNDSDAVAKVEDEADSEDWDFEEDDDIFNEENDALSAEKDDDSGGMLKEALEHASKPLTPPPASKLTVPRPPPPPPLEQSKQQKLEKNPFLSNENGDKDANPEPTLIAEVFHDNSNIVNNDNADADGWSDEDFFEDDDLISSSSAAPQPAKVPHPPPQPVPVQQSSAHSIAQRTRARTAQQQHQSFAAQPMPPAAPPQPMALNPAQGRIHQMLSTYTSTLHDPNFLKHLHQQLHLTKNNKAASDLKTYYATRPGLRKYTLGVELDRMDYQLILPNGKAANDKDVLRSYFGVGSDGERVDGPVGGEEDMEVVTTEELLIRSANQSLLADMLVALTGSEEDIMSNNGFSSEDNFFDGIKQDGRYQAKKSQSAGLILSGPTLCMTSVAESCNFKVDLACGLVEGVCCLAISIPFHSNNGSTIEAPKDIVDSGRLVLARSQVSVRFRPGEGGSNDEPTVQYAVQSVTPFHAPNSPLLVQAAISLAHDMTDPFFHNEFEDADGEAGDARDRFLLSHHLADSGMLVVSDHIDKLRDAAEASSTGFKSALRQLDGVTNVSAKLQFLKDTAGAAGQGSGGLGGFGLSLPSAEEIEAAEREAAMGGHYPHGPPPPPSDAEFRFPRPENIAHGDPSRMRNVHPSQPTRPPPPPPPMPPQTEATAARPRPIIGGLFMSGLSRLAAAATQPDESNERSAWEGGGGTGLTPPSSPPSNAAHLQRNEHPSLYRREGNEGHAPASGRNFIVSQPPSIDTQGEWSDKPRGFTGLTPLAAQRPPQQHSDHFEDLTPAAAPPSPTDQNEEVKEQDSSPLVEDGEDAGWSDDEFDFDDEVGDDKEKEACSADANIQIEEHRNVNMLVMAEVKPDVTSFETKEYEGTSYQPHIPQHPKDAPGSTRAVSIPPPPPPSLPQQKRPTNQLSRTFEEEFVIVLKEKIDAECQEMNETGRMKRWTPIREDPILRERLMEVMVSQIHS